MNLRSRLSCAWSGLLRQSFCRRGAETCRHARKGAGGFTLLEVMVALTVLALVGLAAIQSSGRNLMGMSDTARRDAILREGRNRFYEIMCQELVKPADKQELGHWGTLAPVFPDVDWAMRKVRLQELPGYRLEFCMKDRFSNGQEQCIDYVLPH